MVKLSTWVILFGVILLLLPLPPLLFVLSAIVGILIIVLGVILRFSGN